MAGRGASSVGLVDPDSGRVVLCADLVTRPPARRFSFGPFRQRALPIAGDWNGDGLVGVGLYSPSISTFRLRNGSDGFIGHRSVVFGPTGGRPIAGDWKGSGRDGIGLYDPTSGIFFLKDEASDGPADHVVAFGVPGEDLWPIAGRFTPDAPPGDSVGLYDPRRGVFFTRSMFEDWAGQAGFRELEIRPLHEVGRPFTAQTLANLRLAAGLDESGLPGWCWERLAVYDESFSPELKRDLLIEGSVVLRK